VACLLTLPDDESTSELESADAELGSRKWMPGLKKNGFSTLGAYV
jgi:hypothetical protein